jgi:hypothetical protein
VERQLAGAAGSPVTLKVRRSTVRLLLLHRRDLLIRSNLI